MCLYLCDSLLWFSVLWFSVPECCRMLQPVCLYLCDSLFQSVAANVSVPVWFSVPECCSQCVCTRVILCSRVLQPMCLYLCGAVFQSVVVNVSVPMWFCVPECCRLCVCTHVMLCFRVWTWSPQPSTTATVMSRAPFLSLDWASKSDRWVGSGLMYLLSQWSVCLACHVFVNCYIPGQNSTCVVCVHVCMHAYLWLLLQQSPLYQPLLIQCSGEEVVLHFVTCTYFFTLR